MGRFTVDDPVLQRALDRVERSHARAQELWLRKTEAFDGDDLRDEAADHAQSALEHLEGSRWDEAAAACELAIELAEELGQAKVWRELSILIDEVVEIAHDTH